MTGVVRYFRSPEFVLAVANFALMVALWGFEWLDELEPFMNALVSVLPFPSSINEIVVIGLLVGLLGIFMLPATWFVLLAAVMELIRPGDSFNVTVAWLSLPNAVLWGFAVAFLFRLIRTGGIAKARAATLQWATGRDKLESDGMR